MVDAIHELPVSPVITPANGSDAVYMEHILKKAELDKPGCQPKTATADKDYDRKFKFLAIFKKYYAAPVIPVIEKPDWETLYIRLSFRFEVKRGRPNNPTGRITV